MLKLTKNRYLDSLINFSPTVGLRIKPIRWILSMWNQISFTSWWMQKEVDRYK